MAKFYGTIDGGRSIATRTGTTSVTASVQSYKGSIITRLFEENGKQMVNVAVGKNESTRFGNTIFSGTIDELVSKLQN